MAKKHAKLPSRQRVNCAEHLIIFTGEKEHFISSHGDPRQEFLSGTKYMDFPPFLK